MSLLSLIATNTFISFMSDGRVYDHENNEVIDESFKKIFKVNNKVIYAVGGNFNAAKVLEEHIHHFDGSNARSFAHSLFNELGNGKVHKELHIFIGGTDEKNQIYYSGFSQNSTALIEIQPKPLEIRFACNETGENQNINYFDLFDEIVNQNKNYINIEKAKMIQNQLNNRISTIDKTVNTKTFHEFISI